MDVGRCPTCQSPLKYTKLSSKCDACYEDYHDNKQGYKCDYCSFCLHEECINANLPSRHKHPLKVTNSYNSKLCYLCETKSGFVGYVMSMSMKTMGHMLARFVLIFFIQNVQQIQTFGMGENLKGYPKKMKKKKSNHSK